MSNANDGFESVKNDSSAVWEPKQTGKKKDATLKALEAGDASWIVGWYLGSKEISNNNGTSVVHKIKMDKVGDENHIQGEMDAETKELSIWGTGVLNDNLGKITPGQYIKVLWEGKVAPKKGSNPYHTWDVLVNTSVPALDLGGAPAVAEKTNQAAEIPAGDDDDLPF